MKHTNHSCADLHQRPAKRWSKALMALALPAVRVHNYRNLHRTMFYDAVCEMDCRDAK